MVKPYDGEDRLKGFHSQVRLIHAGNYEQAVEFFRSKVLETPEFCIDLETYVSEESDEWVERSSKKGGGVDVLGSMITPAAALPLERTASMACTFLPATPTPIT